MNTKFKFALIRRYSEQGFAMPVAIGLGLIMLLIGATMIVRSQGDQVTALAQKATNQGLSAAETGVARYQSLINNNRIIATYKDCEGTRSALGVCPDTGTTKSWTNATNIPGIASCSGGGATPVIDNSTIAWRDVSTEDLNGNGTLDTGEDINGNGTLDSNSSLGQYRLVKYVYPAPGTTGTTSIAPGIGQLTVEGRVNQSGSGSTATTGLGTATTRLQVNIPTQQGDSRTVPVPGLWFNTGTLGPRVGNGNTVNGNLLYTGGCDPNSVGGTINGTRTAVPGLDFPDLPTPPTSFPASNTLGNITSGSLILPRLGDSYVDKVINGYKVRVYEYKVTSINLGGGESITIIPGKRVTFYLEGNIETGGSAAFTHSCTGYISLGSLTPVSTTTDFPIPPVVSTSPLVVSTNPLNEDCKPSNLQIFGYGKNNLTGTAISDPKICLNGNGFLQAFILGPTYKAGVAGAGAGGGFKGSVWVNQWSNGSGCGSNTSNVVIDQTTTWDELIPLGLTIKNLPPILSPISSWQRQEAQ